MLFSPLRFCIALYKFNKKKVHQELLFPQKEIIGILYHCIYSESRLLFLISENIWLRLVLLKNDATEEFYLSTFVHNYSFKLFF